MNKNQFQNRNKQSGFSLIEVLVALLVLSIGLLGLAALQTTSLQYNTDSYTRTQATLLAYDIIDRMRSNATGFTGGDYDVADETAAANVVSTYNGCKGSSCACATTTCDAATLATYDLGQWYDRMGQLLPESTSAAKLAKVERDAVTTSPTYNRVTITIRWKERDLDKQQQWMVQL